MCLRKYVIVCVGGSLKEGREGKWHSFRQVCIFAVRMKELHLMGFCSHHDERECSTRKEVLRKR